MLINNKNASTESQERFDKQVKQLCSFVGKKLNVIRQLRITSKMFTKSLNLPCL